ncbi:MAG: hypothetical protein ABIQ66_00745 [Novosphingobium sp.]
MNLRTLFGLMALVPASLNAAPPAPGALIVPLCSSSDGAPQMIRLVGMQDNAPLPAVGACCAKGCHGARKRRAMLEPAE